MVSTQLAVCAHHSASTDGANNPAKILQLKERTPAESGQPRSLMHSDGSGGRNALRWQWRAGVLEGVKQLDLGLLCQSNKTGSNALLLTLTDTGSLRIL